MAHIWIKEQAEWMVLPLAEQALDLTHPMPRYLPPTPGAKDQVRLVPMRIDDQLGPIRYLLMAGPGTAVRVNGGPIPGLKVLADRDEIQLANRPPLYFAVHSLPAVAYYQPVAGSDAIECPRCRGVIEPGTAAVCCPNCQVFQHQVPEESLECWTYDLKCAACGFPTALDSDYGWAPDEV